jgi:hypothetical protein
MKIAAFCMAVFVVAVGVLGIIVPSSLVWIAQHSTSSAAFYVIAAIRITFGLILISAASVSRAPKTLRIFGYLILVAGIATALTGLIAIEHARALIDWWLQQGFGVLRLTSVLLAAFGGFIAHAVAPNFRPA